MEHNHLGGDSLQAEEARAAEIMENATLRRPAIPDETRLDVKIADQSLGQAVEQVSNVKQQLSVGCCAS